MSLFASAGIVLLIVLCKVGLKHVVAWLSRFLRVLVIVGFVHTASAQEPEPEPETTIEPATVQCFGLGMIVGVLCFGIVSRNLSL